MRAALLEARTPADIIAGVAGVEWRRVHPGEDCPPEMIPSSEAVAAWLSPTGLDNRGRPAGDPPCPVAARRAASDSLCVVFRLEWPADRLPRCPHGSWQLFTWPSQAAIVALVFDVSGCRSGSVDHVHRLWREMPEGERPAHPLAAIIREWQAKPRETPPFLPKRRGSLPRLHKLTDEDVQLPDLPGREPTEGTQLALPGFELEIPHCPSWLLWMFDRAGGESMAAGRGAPWDMRLFVGALLHLATGERDGHWRTLRFPHLRRHEADWPVLGTPSIEAWLHPNGWTNRRRDWERLPAALHRIRRELSYVPVPGIGSVAVLLPSAIPKSPDDPLVEFTIRIPKAAASGARIEWPRLRQYGTESAAHYRAYLAVAAYLDRSARHGHPITREVAAPLLHADGRPVRRKGGRIVRSSHDTVDNPAARYVPLLTDADLARMIGLDGDDRKHRFLARRARTRLEIDGVIEVETDRNGSFRLFGPGKRQ